MLVLSAVYKSKNLKQFIMGPDRDETPKQIMKRLFARTISMLKDLKPISAALYQDQRILTSLRDVVFEGEDEEADESEAPALRSSFSSL